MDQLAGASFLSARSQQFRAFQLSDVIRLIHQYQPVNLAIGVPERTTPDPIKAAAVAAIQADMNQYVNSWGLKELRDAIADKVARTLQLQVDPETEMTVTCGSTEALLNVLLAVIDPGDEVIVFEPVYENFLAALAVCGAVPRFVRLHEPTWQVDPAALAAAFSNKTKAILVNTPNNPTGKVFSAAELQQIADLCLRWNVLCLSDEIYEYLVFDGGVHVSPATLPGMRERTIIINGLSKTYAMTGWRIGYVLAPPAITRVIRMVHDCTTVSVPTPLQVGGVAALTMPADYYAAMSASYQARRDRITPILNEVGFACYPSQGAFYAMVDIRGFGYATDMAFVRYLIKEIGVALAPGSSFFANPADGYGLVRLSFARSDQTIQAAEQRLAALKTESLKRGSS